MIPAGRLRHLVTFQKATISRGSTYSEPIETWAAISALPSGQAWVDIRPLSGREIQVARETFGEADYAIRMRYVAGITNAMRIVYGSRIFQIAAPPPGLEAGRDMEIICREVRNDG